MKDEDFRLFTALDIQLDRITVIDCVLKRSQTVFGDSLILSIQSAMRCRDMHERKFFDSFRIDPHHQKIEDENDDEKEDEFHLSRILQIG
jgi:hypothetical protein